MLSILVHFSPGFPLGGGFPAEQNTHIVICMNTARSKNRFPEVLCVFRIQPEQKPDSLLSGKFPSLRNSIYRQSSSPRNTLLQRAVELRGSSLFLLLRSLTTTLEQIVLREILLLEGIQGLRAPGRTPF
jgi:hypothetical protein